MPFFVIPVIVVLAGLLVLAFLLFFVFGFTIIGTNEMGILAKKWTLNGKKLEGGIIALNGEAGYVPDVLRAGIHFRSRIFYSLYKYPLVVVPQDEMAYVASKSGLPLDSGQALARDISYGTGGVMNFENARWFLDNGGQKGMQRVNLREGVYAINLALFVVYTKAGVKYHQLSGEEANVYQSTFETLVKLNAFNPVVVGGKTQVTKANGEIQVVSADNLAVIIVNEGKTIPASEENDAVKKGANNVTVSNASTVIAPDMTRDSGVDHNDFQNAEAFIQGGGYKGTQERVLIDGKYFINKLFAKVEYYQKTIINPGEVGVVVSYSGKFGEDKSGTEYKHGSLVECGCRGIWDKPLQAGKHVINPHAYNIIIIPVTNIRLSWNSHLSTGSTSQSERLDESLAEIELITADAYEPILPLSAVIHIAPEEAPKIIQKFGSIQDMVSKTLDPLISKYFKDTAQGKTVLEFVGDRKEIQEAAYQYMHNALSRDFNVELVEIILGTLVPKDGDTEIELLLSQLRQRQLAEERKTTLIEQQKTLVQEKEYQNAKAIADAQEQLTKSDIEVQIANNRGAAKVKEAENNQKVIELQAAAEAKKIREVETANAEMIALRGTKEADAIKAKTEAYGGVEMQVLTAVVERVTDAIAKSGTPIVPSIVMGGGSNTDAVTNLLGLVGASVAGVDVKELIGKKLPGKERETVIPVETEKQEGSDIKEDTGAKD